MKNCLAYRWTSLQITLGWYRIFFLVALALLIFSPVILYKYLREKSA